MDSGFPTPVGFEAAGLMRRSGGLWTRALQMVGRGPTPVTALSTVLAFDDAGGNGAAGADSLPPSRGDGSGNGGNRADHNNGGDNNGGDNGGDEAGVTRVRTLFLSDIHLGARGSQADKLVDFLRHYDAGTIYLVGDIIDGWALKSTWYWPQANNDVVQKLLRKARKGARIIYVPGNHDEFLRGYFGTHFGGIEVVEDAIHDGADGRRYLVIHGDLFDLVVQNARWLAHLGDKAYDFALFVNRVVNGVRRALGAPYWSLSQWAKLKVKNAVNFISAFEDTLAGEARRRGTQGVICGHIHYATIRDFGDIRYVNCGDWVESCTAVIEHADGRMEIIAWTDMRHDAPALAAAVAALNTPKAMASAGV